ncbi:MAG: putative GNAT family N-acyltransferase [Planctomycetota bacterium]|jgi:predicted GNAT family N-acyltransferase
MIEYLTIDMASPYYQGERELRNLILLRPIGIPDFGWEMRDKDSFHFVAISGQDVVGCVVLYPNPENPTSAQLMQMGVSESMQGKGVGTELVKQLVQYAKANKIEEVTCHSRLDAVLFYAKLDFELVGEPFVEADVVHRHMTLKLGN